MNYITYAILNYQFSKVYVYIAIVEKEYNINKRKFKEALCFRK